MDGKQRWVLRNALSIPATSPFLGTWCGPAAPARTSLDSGTSPLRPQGTSLASSGNWASGSRARGAHFGLESPLQRVRLPRIRRQGWHEQATPPRLVSCFRDTLESRCPPPCGLALGRGQQFFKIRNQQKIPLPDGSFAAAGGSSEPCNTLLSSRNASCRPRI